MILGVVYWGPSSKGILQFGGFTILILKAPTVPWFFCMGVGFRV